MAVPPNGVGVWGSCGSRYACRGAQECPWSVTAFVVTVVAFVRMAVMTVVFEALLAVVSMLAAPVPAAEVVMVPAGPEFLDPGPRPDLVGPSLVGPALLGPGLLGPVILGGVTAASPVIVPTQRELIAVLFALTVRFVLQTLLWSP